MGTVAGPPGIERPVPPRSHPRREARWRYREIVDAAARLFSEQGYAATSVQEIADAVGLLKGSLYHYISTKEDLLYAVLAEAHQHTAAVAEEALRHPGDTREKLAFVIEHHLRNTGDHLAKLQVFDREANFLSPSRFAVIQADRDSYEQALRTLIRRGRESGELASHLDPTLTSFAILAILNSPQQWFRADGTRTVDDLVRVFTDLILRSVAPTPDHATNSTGESPT